MRGLDVLLSIDGKAVAAQEGATLNRNAGMARVTNLIKLDWEEFLPQAATWTINCNGAYIVDDDALSALELAFVEKKKITVTIKDGNTNYKGGEAYISSFPIGATFSKEVTYNITLQGTGGLI